MSSYYNKNKVKISKKKERFEFKLTRLLIHGCEGNTINRIMFYLKYINNIFIRLICNTFDKLKVTLIKQKNKCVNNSVIQSAISNDRFYQFEKNYR